jgi:hypothetical protein
MLSLDPEGSIADSSLRDVLKWTVKNFWGKIGRAEWVIELVCRGMMGRVMGGGRKEEA